MQKALFFSNESISRKSVEWILKNCVKASKFVSGRFYIWPVITEVLCSIVWSNSKNSQNTIRYNFQISIRLQNENYFVIRIKIWENFDLDSFL